MKKAIEAAVSMAYAYLIGTEWIEFSTLRHGPSTAVDWIGGFIRRCLPDLPNLPTEVFPRFGVTSSNDLDSEANWCLALGRPLTSWRSHLVDDHGSIEGHGLSTFTYSELRQMYPWAVNDCGSWCSSHFEVTALALQSEWHLDDGSFHRNQASSWLAGQIASGKDQSYWWSTDSYGWHLSMELKGKLVHLSLCCSDNSVTTAKVDMDVAIPIYRRLISSRQWLNRYCQPCSFTMALNLMSWLKVWPEHESVNHLADQLIQRQQSDGSWRAPAILRIPDPKVGIGQQRCRRVAEDKGLLTTATVTQALKRYAEYLARL